MKTRVNGFTITKNGNLVTIEPGTLMFPGIRNHSCSFQELDNATSFHRFTNLIKYAKTNKAN